jgi:hypothetical protein
MEIATKGGSHKEGTNTAKTIIFHDRYTVHCSGQQLEMGLKPTTKGISRTGGGGNAILRQQWVVINHSF